MNTTHPISPDSESRYGKTGGHNRMKGWLTQASGNSGSGDQMVTDDGTQTSGDGTRRMDDGDNGINGEGEGRLRPRALPVPELPSMREILEHELTHLPYRAWCRHRVRARAVADRHEGALGHNCDDPTILTTFAMDYMYLTEKAGYITTEELRTGRPTLGKPILVEYDKHTGAVFGHQVQCKGSMARWAVTRVRDDIETCGYGGSMIRLRSDQENPIKDLMKKIIEGRRGPTVPEHSAVGDSK